MTSTDKQAEKRIVNYANSPMTFVYNHVPIKSLLEKRKEIPVEQMGLL